MQKCYSELIALSREGGLDALRRVSELYRDRVFEARDAMGADVLMVAVENRNLDVVRFLCELGCDVNRQDLFGRTAMDRILSPCEKDPCCKDLNAGDKCSIESRDEFQIVKALVLSGACIRRRHAKTGTTVIHHAIARNRRAVVAALIEFGANPLDACDRGIRAIDMCASGWVRAHATKVGAIREMSFKSSGCLIY